MDTWWQSESLGMHKTCRRCNESKPIDKFNWRNKSKNKNVAGVKSASRNMIKIANRLNNTKRISVLNRGRSESATGSLYWIILKVKVVSIVVKAGHHAFNLIMRMVPTN